MRKAEEFDLYSVFFFLLHRGNGTDLEFLESVKMCLFLGPSVTVTKGQTQRSEVSCKSPL